MFLRKVRHNLTLDDTSHPRRQKYVTNSKSSH